MSGEHKLIEGEYKHFSASVCTEGGIYNSVQGDYLIVPELNFFIVSVS